jgi:hypothetical protein
MLLSKHDTSDWKIAYSVSRSGEAESFAQALSDSPLSGPCVSRALRAKERSACPAARPRPSIGAALGSQPRRLTDPQQQRRIRLTDIPGLHG